MGYFLDIDQWNRLEHFLHFRDMARPFFSVCVEVDVTELRAACRAERRSFFLASLFHALRAANETEPMRFRLRDEGVWVHERVRVSSTVLRNDDTFGCIRLDHQEDPAAFERRGAEEIDAIRRGAGPAFADGADDVIYHSTLPWIRFTGFTNALPLGNDSIPRVVFGKCFSRGPRWMMPVALEVHHALMDGLDVARFLDRFERSVEAPS